MFKSPNGNIKDNSVNFNPFLSTLNGDGSSQVRVQMVPFSLLSC